jgi:hypothetical protein
MFVPLIKEAQLGNGHATGSNPAGDEHGTKAGFRDRTRVATADGLAVHKTGENSVVELTMGSSVFKQGMASVQHLQDSGTKAEHTVQRKRGYVAVLQAAASTRRRGRRPVFCSACCAHTQGLRVPWQGKTDGDRGGASATLVVKARLIHRRGAARLGMSMAARRLQLGVEVGALLERDDVAWRCASRWWLRDAAHPAGDDVSQRIQKAPTQHSLPPSLLLHPLPFFSSGAAVNFRAG